MKPLLPVLLCTTLLYISCKKENTASTPRLCRVTEQTVYLNDVDTFTVSYSYEGSRIAKLQNSRNHYTTVFEYAGGQLIRRAYYYGNNTSPNFYDLIRYHPDGTVSVIEGYYKNYQENGVFEKAFEVVFVYTRGIMSHVRSFAWSNGVKSPRQEFDFLYTAGNITRVDWTDHYRNQPTYTYTVNYDDKENYLTKNGALAWLYDVSVGEDNYGAEIYNWNEGGVTLVSFLGTNNVVAINVPGPNSASMPIAYSTDSVQNLVEISVLGGVGTKYVYECR